jgi:TRAP-type C4-dicarboxylate transport system permease small subunit
MSDTTLEMAREGTQPSAVVMPAPLRLLSKVVDWTVISIGAVMIALIFANVVLHAFGKDLAWVTELGELLMVWVTFLGGACAAQRGAHMSITEFIDKLPRARRRLADMAVQGMPACCGAGALLLVYGYRLWRQLGKHPYHPAVADGLAVHGHGDWRSVDGWCSAAGTSFRRCAACRVTNATPTTTSPKARLHVVPVIFRRFFVLALAASR